MFVSSRLLTSSLMTGLLLSGALHAAEPSPVPGKHTFALGTEDFLLDGQPVQIRSGELHPGRIPREYWRHRLRMVKASGMNTVAIYLFWNQFEEEEGKFDFKTGERDIAAFIKLAQEEGLWVLLRPGPYVCGEWDLGGIPAYLMRDPKVQLRSSADENYLKAVQRYIEHLVPVVKPYLVTNGGPIVMVQVENEFGSYGEDRKYLEFLHDQWKKNGIDVPFYTADGPTDKMMKNGTLPGCAVGLDSGTEDKHWDIAKKHNPGVPVFSSETYPGWLTHWGEKWQNVGVDGVIKDMKWYMDNKKSFNFYVFHGGTNFGFTAGANDGGKGKYQADITSYDYDAILTEQGRPTAKYDGIRSTIAAALPDLKLPPVPEPIPAIEVPEFKTEPFALLRDNMPGKPVPLDQPKSFEELGQYHQGLMLYTTTLPDNRGGKLDFGTTGVRDYGLVYLDGKFIGKLDRNLAETTIDLPATTGTEKPMLTILAEAMGHINFGRRMSDDRKGLLGPVKLGAAALTGWHARAIPLADADIAKLKPGKPGADDKGVFFKGGFTLEKAADTFIDLSAYKKGVVWVNGHNLGRFWEIGPQKRLYCPAPWLKAGKNEIIILDLLQAEAAPVSGKSTLR
ncbi:beta-galactosidase [Luteolibacter ambystomatis]|uniref:Beta-galactosidase n=2 Tax=Luteolibacter ambystomatis TaxID=2824561 RepID=A0A975PFE1_9BACT|nr:beta-galactosidase family protein [Luteolibacter ambystomatis]QUE51968.1 beta-galactosidase [Luteolibacter ambystomatis]